MHPDLKELLTRPLLTEALGAGARAAGEFLEGRSRALGEELDRLADEVGLDRGARTQGPIQDVIQGLDPTGVIIPERDSPNPLIGLAAGLLSPDPMDAAKAGKFLKGFGNFARRMSRESPEQLPDLLRRLSDDVQRAIAGAPTEAVREFDDAATEVVLNTRRTIPSEARHYRAPSGSGVLGQTEPSMAGELILSRSTAELAERAGRGDLDAARVFELSFDPEDFTEFGTDATQDFLEEPSIPFIDFFEMERTAANRRGVGSMLAALLGID